MVRVFGSVILTEPIDDLVHPLDYPLPTSGAPRRGRGRLTIADWVRRRREGGGGGRDEWIGVGRRRRRGMGHHRQRRSQSQARRSSSVDRVRWTPRHIRRQVRSTLVVGEVGLPLVCNVALPIDEGYQVEAVAVIDPDHRGIVSYRGETGRKKCSEWSANVLRYRILRRE